MSPHSKKTRVIIPAYINKASPLRLILEEVDGWQHVIHPEDAGLGCAPCIQATEPSKLKD